jgi:hypothetical protein
MSWIDSRERESAHREEDALRLRLERVRGKVGHDGLELASTQCLLDILEVPQRARNAATCRRLAQAMRDLEWKPVKARGITEAGYRDQLGGWAPEARDLPCRKSVEPIT